MDDHEVVGRSQPFCLAYQEVNNRDLLSQYGALCARIMKHWRDRQTITSAIVGPTSVIRVGIVSAHVRNHSVWNTIVKGWLQHIDRNRFEIHVFHSGIQEDSETAWAKAHSTSFEHGAGGVRQWVDAIEARRPDVLIYPEVGMDPMTAKLASLRLAPVQIAAWGHPETTGLPTIDYYLTAEAFEPPGAREHYTEELVALPRLGCCYTPSPATAGNPDLAGLGIDPEVPILLCPGTPFKYAPQYDPVLIEIARKLGRCQFVFFVSSHRSLSEKLRGRLEANFARSGLHFRDYGVFIPWQARSSFFGLMRRADVVLDTIGFSGFNTAMQAVECGLPMVTREGRFMRGRLASGILRTLGISELIAGDADAYIDLAVKLSVDARYRQHIRQRIENSRDILIGDTATVRALEDFLIRAAQRN
jgi:predicted O-linked N-acetylglucosamine transferase (SPINDLY family)